MPVSAFQTNAFQNDCDGGTKGFQCAGNLPKPGTEVESVYIDSTVELMADHFSLQLPSPTAILTDDTLDRVNIQLGLKDACVTPLEITHISDGPIDERELTITPTSQEARIRGRDHMADVLDCEYRMMYIRANYLANGVLDDATQSQIDGTASKTITFADGTIVTIPAQDYKLGVFTAKQIAQEVATSIGLTLVWQVRDYELQSTFSATGRAIDTIKKLIEPWVTVEPYRAEVLMQGQTLIIRHRQLPGTPFKPDYVFDVTGMKRGQITIRKRSMRAAGRLRLVGRAQQIKTNFVSVVDDTGEEVDVEQTTIVPATGADPTEKKIVTQTRYHLPEQIVLRQFKDVYAPHKVEHTEVYNDYIDTEVGKLLSVSRSTTQKWDESISSLAAFQRTTQFNTYDDDTFLLRNQTTVTEDVDPLISTYVASKMVTKVIYDLAPGMAEERVTEYAPSAGMSDGADAAAGSAFWDAIRQDSQIQAGHRAGGSGRKSIFIPNFPGTKANIEINTTIDTDHCAPSVTYSNEHMTYQDLLFLKSLYEAAADLAAEWEVIFEGVAMPWLQKGKVVQVNGLTGPWGDPITLPLLYMTEVRTTYDESKAEAKFVSTMRAFGWQ